MVVFALSNISVSYLWKYGDYCRWNRALIPGSWCCRGTHPRPGSVSRRRAYGTCLSHFLLIIGFIISEPVPVILAYALTSADSESWKCGCLLFLKSRISISFHIALLTKLLCRAGESRWASHFRKCRWTLVCLGWKGNPIPWYLRWVQENP